MSSNAFAGENGYWGSTKAVQEVPRTAAVVARHLRKIARQELGYVRKVEVWRRTIDLNSAHEKIRKRKVNRVYKPMRGSRGFVVVNDGLHHAEVVAQLLSPGLRPRPSREQILRARGLWPIGA